MAAIPVTFCGYMWYSDRGVGGGPMPPGEGGGGPVPPLGIWGPTDPRPTPPIYWPGFPGGGGGGQPGGPVHIWGPPDMPPGFWGGGMGPGVKPQPPFPGGPRPSHPIALPGDPWWGSDLHPAHPIVIPPDAIAPGVPTHPIYIPVYPAHPIVIPPEAIGPGVPTHPIYLPPPHPEHPIVIPPDAIAPGVPTHPIYIPVYPAHPIVLPPDWKPPTDPPPDLPPVQPDDPTWSWGWNVSDGWHPVYVPEGGKPRPIHPANPGEGTPPVDPNAPQVNPLGRNR